MPLVTQGTTFETICPVGAPRSQGPGTQGSGLVAQGLVPVRFEVRLQLLRLLGVVAERGAEQQLLQRNGGGLGGCSRELAGPRPGAV